MRTFSYSMQGLTTSNERTTMAAFSPLRPTRTCITLSSEYHIKQRLEREFANNTMFMNDGTTPLSDAPTQMNFVPYDLFAGSIFPKYMFLAKESGHLLTAKSQGPGTENRSY